jgi:phospholipid/cholesterol/gamma-HCH transport system substrate-binding protein
MQRGRQDLLLGLVFFGTLAALLWATATLSNFSLQPRQEIEVRFERAAGLKRGDPVFVVGTRNGEVLEVAYQPGSTHRIKVLLQLEDEVTLFSDATVEINESTLLGGKQIDIDPGVSDARWPAGQVLVGTAGDNPLRALGEKIEGADIEGFFRSWKAVADKLDSGQGSAAKLLNEPTLYDDIAASARSLRVTIEEVERGRGAIGRAIHDVELGQQVADSVAALRDLIRTLQTGEGLLPRIIHDPELGQQAADVFADLRGIVRDLREGRSAAGKLLGDPATAAKVDSIVGHFESVAAKLDDPSAGLAGGLFGDTEWRQQFDRLLGEASDYAWKMNRGEGLLSMLVNDPDLARRVNSMFRQVARAIEDAREAGPVGTIFQMVFAPF